MYKEILPRSASQKGKPAQVIPDCMTDLSVKNQTNTSMMSAFTNLTNYTSF